MRETLGELGGSLLAREAAPGVLTLRLPSTARGPQSSPEFVSEEEPDLSAPSLSSWEVPALALDAGAALDLLLALPVAAPSGLAFGSSLCFWVVAARFAYELLSRQCYAPALQESGEDEPISLRAAWEPVLSSEDIPRVNSLAELMPPVCWSLIPAGQPVPLPRMLLMDFLDHTIDAFVRASLLFREIAQVPGKRGNRPVPLPEQWLRALSSPDSRLEASPRELEAFADLMFDWFELLSLGQHDAMFRTCFRLDPPAEEDDEDRLVAENQEHGMVPKSKGKQKNGTSKESKAGQGSAAWRMSFYLQANDDRSLLVPAENVWQERSSTLTFLKRSFENPQERLLADLGRAARLFPAIEESLKSARPGGLLLNTGQAYTFLREAAPLLEQSGFGVLIPPWWRKPAARLGVKLKIRPKAGSQTSSGLLGMQGIVSYDWSISIGNMTLTAEEFEKLVQLKQPLIQVRGQWVELHASEIERAIAFFQKKRRAGSMTLGEALRTGLGQGQSELGLPVTDIESEGWITELLAHLSDNNSISSIPAPAAFQGQLRPYQLRGVSWLAFLQRFGFGACLADDMGLGKTAQLISLLLHKNGEADKNSPAGTALVICPMSIVGNWQREIQRFAPSLKVMIHHGHERLSGEAFVEEARQHDVVLTTYALALRDREHLAGLEWEHVVVDEAQNIKNESARQTQAIKSLNARHRVALTGTPVENRLSELWSIMEFLNPGYLGSATDFRQRFTVPIERYHDQERADLLKRVIQPFVLRRVKTDKSIIADLPEKQELKVYCNLTQEQASLYEAVVKEMIEKIEKAEEDIERRGLILATLLKLKQVCNHPAQFVADSSKLPGRSGKLARLEEMLEEVLATGEKALIFSQFAEMGTLLRRHLQETFASEVFFLHGGVPKKHRDSMVQRFQEDQRGPQIFILSLKAGGVGLNLTAANHVFHFDRWWNPAVENQATDRAFRIGQTKNVQVHKFVCVGTLEERIDQMIEQKKALADNIVGSGENWLTEMSTTQLKELFALSREAVGE
ncbi:MAG TPA: DEAD/DEAH box helicase [Ktedonobacteraceae bacterium]